MGALKNDRKQTRQCNFISRARVLKYFVIGIIAQFFILPSLSTLTFATHFTVDNITGVICVEEPCDAEVSWFAHVPDGAPAPPETQFIDVSSGAALSELFIKPAGSPVVAGDVPVLFERRNRDTDPVHGDNAGSCIPGDPDAAIHLCNTTFNFTLGTPYDLILKSWRVDSTGMNKTTLRTTHHLITAFNTPMAQFAFVTHPLLNPELDFFVGFEDNPSENPRDYNDALFRVQARHIPELPKGFKIFLFLMLGSMILFIRKQAFRAAT